jgi:Domain of unknown function (DUF1707)
MARYESLRASDADREAVTDRLRQAAGEGRLEPEELEERVEAALRARTYGELSPLVADLPGRERSRRRTPPVLMVAGAIAAVTLAVLVVVLVVAAMVLTAAWWIALALFWFLCCSSRRRFPSGPAWRHRGRMHRTRPTGLL